MAWDWNIVLAEIFGTGMLILLGARAGLQRPQLERVRRLAERVWTLPWQLEPPVGAERLAALAGAGRAR